MNNYIIDPSIFYWMNVLDAIRGITTFIAIMSGGLLVIAIILYFMSIHEEEHEYAKICRKLMFISGIIMVISSIIIIFIPDKRTSIEMLIARTATYENAQLTVQGIKEVVDYIVQTIKSI